jgi:uncharacterized protein (TIGR03083 family)
METSGYLDAIRDNAGRLVEAARRAGLDAPVPTCPDWTVADLVRHQGRVFRWISGMVEAGAQEFVSPKGLNEQAKTADPLPWVEEGAEQALGILKSADPESAVWNWLDGGPAPARFWWRRMAHETVVHRVDAEAAAGLESRVEPAELASDGIDEFLLFLRVRQPREGLERLAGSFHFHTTDVTGEWVVVFGPGEVQVTREHAKADVAVRGPASGLELFLYNRRGPDGLETFGDPAKVAAWTEVVRF